jgi:para-nitrobenzyl esterase
VPERSALPCPGKTREYRRQPEDAHETHAGLCRRFCRAVRHARRISIRIGPARADTDPAQCAAFGDGGDIPFENTQYRGNNFPGLAWTAGPAETKSYAIIMQDTDVVRNGAPILHWTMYNLPAGVTKLDPGMPPAGKPAGSEYGPNARGEAQPYMGPRPPPGPKHHYHLQIFALDTVLSPDPGMTYDTLTGQMRDHILASGEVVGLAMADPEASLRPPPPPPAR